MSSQQFEGGRMADEVKNNPAGAGLGAQADGMSLGARRVRESFNPSKDNLVDKIKRYTADLIDLCEDLKIAPGGAAGSEQYRLVALAQTHYEDAAMWAVKAATTPK
jgi:hypothetical protein